MHVGKKRLLSWFNKVECLKIGDTILLNPGWNKAHSQPDTQIWAHMSNLPHLSEPAEAKRSGREWAAAEYKFRHKFQFRAKYIVDMLLKECKQNYFNWQFTTETDGWSLTDIVFFLVFNVYSYQVQ